LVAATQVATFHSLPTCRDLRRSYKSGISLSAAATQAAISDTADQSRLRRSYKKADVGVT